MSILFLSMLQLMNNFFPLTGCESYNSSLMDEEVPLCAASIWSLPSRSPPQLMILHKLKSCSPETSHHITSIKTCPSRCIPRWNRVKTIWLCSPLHHTVAHKMDFRPSKGILITGWKKSGCYITLVFVLNWPEWTSVVDSGNHFCLILMLYVQKDEKKNKAHVCQPPIYPKNIYHGSSDLLAFMHAIGHGGLRVLMECQVIFHCSVPLGLRGTQTLCNLSHCWTQIKLK